VEENADLNLEAAELLQQLRKISDAVHTGIQPLVSGWSPIPSKERPWIDDTPQREGVC
jgi:hypothetical protein